MKRTEFRETVRKLSQQFEVFKDTLETLDAQNSQDSLLEMRLHAHDLYHFINKHGVLSEEKQNVTHITQKLVDKARNENRNNPERDSRQS